MNYFIITFTTAPLSWNDQFREIKKGIADALKLLHNHNLFQMLRQVFSHVKHRHLALAAKDRFQVSICIYHAPVFGVL